MQLSHSHCCTQCHLQLELLVSSRANSCLPVSCGAHAELQQTSMQQLGFFLPPPMAIAFSLVRLWANHGQPWFPSTPGTIPSAGPSGSGPTPSNL
jgi:hypothetical protein